MTSETIWDKKLYLYAWYSEHNENLADGDFSYCHSILSSDKQLEVLIVKRQLGKFSSNKFLKKHFDTKNIKIWINFA